MICDLCSSPISDRTKTNKCKRCQLKLRRKARHENLGMKGICAICGAHSAEQGTYCDSCKARQNRNRLLRKIKAMLHYGDKCYCCREDRLAFLTVDHIYGDGNKHRKEIGSNIYDWLIKKNYPPGFRIACSNCNSGASINNEVCPHGE